MRKKMKRIISAALTCLVCTAALTACQESGIFINEDEVNGSYTLSDEVTISSTVVRNINPVTSPDDSVYQISSLVYESLISLDDTLAAQGELAESWVIQDGERAIFTLKNNIKFSDGSSVTAQDVVFSFNACRSADYSPYKSKFDNIASAESDGSSKVVFRLKNGNDISLADFIFPVVSESQFESTSAFLKNTDIPVIGCGRYKIVSADLKKNIILEANEYYSGNKAENRITVKISAIETPYYGLVKSGELSMIVEKSVDREELSGDEKLTVIDFTSNEFETLGFNCGNGPFMNPDLRRAAAYIIDRDEVKRAAYYNSGIKSDDLYYPGYYGTEITNDFQPDSSKANEYLEAAGYHDTDGDGMLEDAEGNELNLRLVINEGNYSRKTAAECVVHDFLKAGITVTVAVLPSESFSGTLSSGSYDMFIGGWKITEDSDLRSFYHSEYSNPAHYGNRELDSQLNLMHSGISGDEMRSAVEKAKTIISEDVPYLCFMYKTYAAVASASLDGLIAPRFNNYYYACEDWKIRIYENEDDSEEYDENTAQDSEDHETEEQ